MSVDSSFNDIDNSLDDIDSSFNDIGNYDDENDENDENENDENENDENENDEKCSVCYNVPDINDIVNTPCGHKFCQTCFFRWFRLNRTCPLCRNDLCDKSVLTDDDFEQEENRLIRRYRILEERLNNLEWTENKLERIIISKNRKVLKLKNEYDLLQKGIGSSRKMICENEGYVDGQYTRYLELNKLIMEDSDNYENYKSFVELKKQNLMNRGYKSDYGIGFLNGYYNYKLNIETFKTKICEFNNKVYLKPSESKSIKTTKATKESKTLNGKNDIIRKTTVNTFNINEKDMNIHDRVQRYNNEKNYGVILRNAVRRKVENVKVRIKGRKIYKIRRVEEQEDTDSSLGEETESNMDEETESNMDEDSQTEEETNSDEELLDALLSVTAIPTQRR